jgi:hypothetical protein
LISGLTDVPPLGSNFYSGFAREVRDQLKELFMGDLAVDFQWDRN